MLGSRAVQRLARLFSPCLRGSKDVQVRSVGHSKPPAGVNVHDWLLVLIQDDSPVMSRFPADRPV